MTYTYDPPNRLLSVTDASGVTSYSYDSVGNLAGFAYPNGIVTSYGYDPLNRLTGMQSTCGAPGSAGPLVCGTGGTALASYAYTLGAAGNRLSVAELSGRTVNYGYDDLYRLTSENIASDPHGNNGQVSCSFDNVGNRLQRNSSLGAIAATGLLNYDANDRTSTDPYDANGNLLNGGVGSNVYDFENHLVAAGGVSVIYDGDGNRVKETVATTTTSFLVADQNLTGYAQVVDELQGGAVSRTYSYGLELINERQTLAGTPTTSFYGVGLGLAPQIPFLIDKANYYFTWFSAITFAADKTLLGLGKLAQNLSSYSGSDFPNGIPARPDAIENASGCNLGRGFPAFDNWEAETGEATQQFTNEPGCNP